MATAHPRLLLPRLPTCSPVCDSIATSAIGCISLPALCPAPPLITISLHRHSPARRPRLRCVIVTPLREPALSRVLHVLFEGGKTLGPRRHACAVVPQTGHAHKIPVVPTSHPMYSTHAPTPTTLKVGFQPARSRIRLFLLRLACWAGLHVPKGNAMRERERESP